MRARTWIILGLALLGALAAAAAYLYSEGEGEEPVAGYPERAVLLYVPAEYAPDAETAPAALAAALAQAAREAPAFGGNIRLAYRPGRGGAAALDEALAQPADGYHVALVAPEYVLAPHRAPEFHPRHDPALLDLLGVVAIAEPVLVGRAEAPWADFAALAAAGGVLGSGPQWTPLDLFAFERCRAAGFRLEPWNYADLTAQAAHLRAGDAERAVYVLPRVLAEPGLADGRLCLIAQPADAPVHPADAGASDRPEPPGVGGPRFVALVGVAVRAGLPQEVRARLAATFAFGAGHEFFRAHAARWGYEARWLPDVDARALIERERAVLGPLVAEYRRYLAGE